MGSAISKLGIVPISIGDGVANADTVKNYFVSGKFTGTYVTQRDLADQSDVEWSIKIAEDGDISLLYDNEDTNATVSALNVTSGKPTSIVFTHKEWFTDNVGSTQASISVAFNTSIDNNSYCYAFNMPDSHIFWDKDNDGEREDYYLSSAPRYYNEQVLKNLFSGVPGVYTLNDGSGWNITVSDDGGLTLSDNEVKTTDAFVDHIKTTSSDPTKITSVYFASPDWYNSKGDTPYQTLMLNWTSEVSSAYAHKSFKCGKAVTFYDEAKTAIKVFTTNHYFIADNGIFSYDYFQGENGRYEGTYNLSDVFKDIYSDDLENVNEYSIVVEDGHVYLCEGSEKTEAVMTSSTKTNNLGRVKEMLVYLPGRYTDKNCTTPAFATLTWGVDNVGKTNKGKGALYFTMEGFEVHKKVDGEIINAYISAMRFEQDILAPFAKSRLAPYQGEYIVNDSTGEKITIKDDRTVTLLTGGREWPALYYNIDSTDWLEGDNESSNVTSVVFSTKDWFAEGKTHLTGDRQTIEMTWSAADLQFTSTADANLLHGGRRSFPRLQ